MSNLTSVGVTSGVPTSGTGTVSTIDNLLALGSPISDGSTNLVAVKAASTAPLATDKALVVAMSPNSVNANGQATMANSAPVVIASNQSALSTTARAFLHNTGTSNGSVISPLTLTAGTDLASLASGAAVTLTGGGATGVSSQTNTGSAQTGLVYLQTVTAGFTPTAGGNVSIWWLFSPDGGTTYETTPATASTTVPALPRAPDCIIPLDVAALGTSAVKVSLPCKLPYGTFKVLVQNNSGAAFGAGNYTLKLVTFAENN